MSKSRCEELASRFAEKAGNGLIDVKFLLHGEELETEGVCEEVVRLYEAVDAGKMKPLDFHDLRWRE